ncbi:MAG: aspartate 1-decarboxylase [Alphaproteobacteria bacterium]
MLLTLMKANSTAPRWTEAHLDYMGSVAIDADLIAAAGFLLWEQVDIYNISNGERFTTYVVEAPAGSRTVSIQGAAAHKAGPGDLIIIVAYAQMEESEARGFKPKVVLLDGKNTPIK